MVSKKLRRVQRILCGGVLPVVMAMSMTAYAAEDLPEETVSGNRVHTISEEELKTAPEVLGAYVNDWFDSFQMIKIQGDERYLDEIQEVYVNEVLWRRVDYKGSLFGSDAYWLNTGENAICFDGSSSGRVKESDKIVIKSNGYQDLELTISKADKDIFEIAGTESPVVPPEEVIPPTEDKKAVPKVLARKGTGFDNYQIIEILEDTEYTDKITEVLVNEENWKVVSSYMALFGAGNYYLHKEAHALWFDGLGDGVLNKGDKLTIKSEGYEDLVLNIAEADSGTFSVTPYDEEKPVEQDILHIRLVGSFEAALKGQLKYDAISGASTSISTNQNSNVIVQAAVLPKGEEPTEEEWSVLDRELGLVVHPDKEKTFVTIEPEGSGMLGVYSPYDGSLTLAGTPVQPGEYQVSVTYTDEQGRTAKSNTLPFVVYEGNEKLCDYLTLSHATQTADGKYMYDMEPWAITAFGGENETVTVPAEIKAWYGSHTSGTYGELGYAVAKEPVQTLIVPAGCNLTMVNMKVLSSVRIVVEDGGRLVLRDSSLHGKVEVQSGGSFSMNYDDYSGKFLTGASVNGQVILTDGAILENASIYSNTNFVANGSEARKNIEPVILIHGNVEVRGQVFIRGDEAPTGTDPATQKSYAGQTALKIEDGTLHIGENSVVAAYGGGYLGTTTIGGTAIQLQNGTITGAGRLIAVGGNGMFGAGGDAVSGNGNLEMLHAYLEGGSAIMPNGDSVTAGVAAADTVTLSDNTNRNLVEGKRITSNSESISDTYWMDITTVPNLSLYIIEENAPGDSQKPEEGENNQKPEEGEDNQKPEEGEDNQKPEEGEDNQKPEEGEDNQKPEEGEDNQKPEEGEDNQKPEEGEDNQKPEEGEDNQKPEKEEDNQKPEEDKQKPEKGESNQEPSEENDSQKPGIKDDSQKPSEGADNQNPSVKPSTNSKKSHSGSSSSTTGSAEPAKESQDIASASSVLSAPYMFYRTYVPSSNLTDTTVAQSEDSAEISSESDVTEIETSIQEDGFDVKTKEESTGNDSVSIEDDEIPLSDHNEKHYNLSWLILVLILITGSIIIMIKKKLKEA